MVFISERGAKNQARILLPGLACIMLTASPVHAWDEADDWKDTCILINLKNGTYTPPPTQYISFVVKPEDSNNDGWYETVLKITIDNKIYRHKEAVFHVTYAGAPFKTSVDIGDSATNDSGGGDAGTQSNDTEIDIGRAEEETSSNLYVFGHDGYQGDLAEVDNIVKQGDTVDIAVSDGRLEFRNKRIPLAGELKSQWLFALKGQPDTEGPVNYDIFASFNRVIAGNYRIGTGVGQVKICVHHGEHHEENDRH